HEESWKKIKGIGAGSSTRLHESPALVGGANVYTISQGKLASIETRTFDAKTGRYTGRRPLGSA
ncbi:hypothetical protein HY251_17580, partial [bacterium]|nr:hypothetical protein [bacterium]